MEAAPQAFGNIAGADIQPRSLGPAALGKLDSDPGHRELVLDWLVEQLDSKVAQVGRSHEVGTGLEQIEKVRTYCCVRKVVV